METTNSVEDSKKEDSSVVEPSQETVAEEKCDKPQEVTNEFKEIDITENEKVSDNSSRSHPPTPTGSGFVKFAQEWSKSTLAYTRQLLSENFGFGTKTVDLELEKQIDGLAESKKMCHAMITQAQNVNKIMSSLAVAQKEFGSTLYEFSLKECNDFKQEMACTGEMYRALQKNTASIEDILNMFIGNLATLSNKAIEDSVQSVRQYDVVRVEYDAFRVQYEEAKKSASGDETKLKEAEEKFQCHLAKFNKSRSDISTKIKLVEENKSKVIKRNLMILQEALAKYSRDTADNLSEISSQYDFKPIGSHSWLESSD